MSIPDDDSSPSLKPKYDFVDVLLAVELNVYKYHSSHDVVRIGKLTLSSLLYKKGKLKIKGKSL